MPIDTAAELLAFSGSLPAWQQDALRRVVIHPNLSAADIRELANLAKAEGGIAGTDDGEPCPLSPQDLTTSHSAGDVVELHAIHSVKNVNALVDGQRIDFESKGLTVVYGENGAGKSGYTRVLRKACRSRKAPDIVPNIKAQPAGPPEAVFSIRIGSSPPTEVRWASSAPSPPELSRFCVFDRESEKGFVDEEGEVAFLPAGLDAFPRLAQLVGDVAKVIAGEQSTLKAEDLSDLARRVAASEEVAAFVSRVRPGLTDREYGQLEADLTKLVADAPALRELQRARISLASAGDPEGKAKELRGLEASLRSFRESVEQIATAIDAAAMERLRQAWGVRESATAAAAAIETATFAAEGARGLGGQAWRELYSAAEKYAIEDFSPERTFPDTTALARCPLCLQPLSDQAKHRLERFRAYMIGEVRGRADHAARLYDALLGKTSITVPVPDPLALVQLAAVLGEDGAKAAVAFESLPRNITQRRDAIRAVGEASQWEHVPRFPRAEIDLVASTETMLSVMATRIEGLADPAAVASVRELIALLEARYALTEQASRVHGAIATLRQSAALGRCHAKMGTRKITDEGKALTSRILTGGLQSSFEGEMKALGASTRIRASIAARGERGRTVYGLSLSDAVDTRWNTSQVLSEGEQRIVALAYFLAEAQLSPEKVGIILDDPVCSLDHHWARRIARRLVELARDRQVVVFTHHISFLIELDRMATECSVAMRRRFVTRGENGPGVCDDTSAPWEKLNIGARVTHFEQELGRLRSLFAKKPESIEYRRGGEAICNALRAGWERAVEEVVLNGVVERFGYAVKTQSLAGVTLDDAAYKRVLDAMTRLSAVTNAHDQAGDAPSPPMSPEEIHREIGDLKSFVSEHKKKSESVKKTRAALARPPSAGRDGTGDATC